MLVGQPPFETASLSETYTRITHNMYVIPQWVSRPARSLIRQLLAPDPRHRPTLEQVPPPPPPAVPVSRFIVD